MMCFLKKLFGGSCEDPKKDENLETNEEPKVTQEFKEEIKVVEEFKEEPKIEEEK
jgi:hypothetical protein